MTEETIKGLVTTAFEYSYLHSDWVHPLAEALEGLTAEQAYWRSCPKCKSIWDIVLHLAVWNENIVERVQSGQVVRPSEGHWPPLPLPEEATDEAWLTAQARLWRSIDSVRNLIESAPLAELENAPYGMGDLFCRFTHMAYHGGQITKLRELKGW